MGTVVKPFNYVNQQVIDASQLDSNLDTLYTWANGNVDEANIKSGINQDMNGIVNAKSPAYKASGSPSVTTGSITSGNNILNLGSPIDFANGQGINIAGNKETSSLQITSPATASANVTVTLNGVAFPVAVNGGVAEVASLSVTSPATAASNVTVTLNGVATNVAVLATDTAINVADKIRATAFTGWTTGGTVGTATVTFTANAVGVQTDATYSAGTTGAAGTMTTTTQGVDADTIIGVATKIRAATYAGWTTGGTAGSDTVTFTSTTTGVKTDATYSAGTTGAAGAMTTTLQGSADLVTTILSGAGTTSLTLVANVTTTVTGVTITHDDTAALQTATTYAINNGKKEIYLPFGTYRYGVLNSTSGLTFIGDGVTLIGTTALNLVSIATLSADVVQRAINIMNPPTPLVAVKADGTDILGDTNRLQAIVNYALSNQYDVYIPKNLTLQPILQSDGTYVCIKFDDGHGATGNDRTPFKIFCKKGVTISSNNTTSAHTIFRWKLGDSIMEGFKFVGTRAYTKALEMSRIVLNNIAEADATTRNRFSDLRFYTCNDCITMEGSAYYNEFNNITFYSSNLALWLKPTYALLNGLLTNDSGVNRNNFYSISAFGCTQGILLDFGDTNKFYSSSFESCGTGITVNDQVATYSLVENTNYNTFYGVTNEANSGMNLVYNGLAGMNSFIDFEAPYTKITLNTRPAYYSQSGSSQSHQFSKLMTFTEDQDILIYKKNRAYIETPTYVKSISDYDGFDGSGFYKGYDWRNFSFTAAQCGNVAALSYNSGGTTANPLYKSMGGIVFYVARLRFTPTVAANNILIPLPALTPYVSMYTFGVFPSMGIPVEVSIDSGTTQITTSGILDGTGNITIKAPTGGWGAGNTNLVLINIFYPRSDIVINNDQN